MTLDPLGGLDPQAVRQTLLASADAAAGLTLKYFRTTMEVENKWAGGFDPVTEADKQAEMAIRKVISERFPNHGIIGEEWDPKLSDSVYNWVVDPIDGTRAFISGIPVWGTLVGLLHQGKGVAGLMAQPFTGETIIGISGATTYHRNGETRTLRTSGVKDLARAKLATTSPEQFEKPERQAKWLTLRNQALQTRYGLDCYAYFALAGGHVDMVVEGGLKNVDIAPMVAIIENAGGVVSTWAGENPENGGNIVAAATPELHAAALKILGA